MTSKQKRFFLLTIVGGLLMGCVLGTTPPSSIPSAGLPHLTETFAVEATRILATDTSRLTTHQTPTQQPINTLTETATIDESDSCPHVLTEPQPSFLTEETIIFWDISAYSLYSLSAQGLELRQFLSDLPCCLYMTPDNISPDRKWLALINEVYNDQEGGIERDLIITTGDGQEQKVTPWDKNWAPILRGWLDKETLILSPGYDAPVGTDILFNPFTGQQREWFISLPHASDHIDPNYSWYTVYDPTLSRVVYSYDGWRAGEGYSIALLDLETNQRLWWYQIPQPFLRFMPPKWSPDGTQFAIALPVEGDGGYEFLLISRDGKIKQTVEQTFLNSLSFEWSPNGKYVAFWAEELTSYRLLLFDVDTSQVIDYCITTPVTEYFPFAPVWSPDSQQLVVLVGAWSPHPDESDARNLLVDQKMRALVQLDSGLVPWGWLTTRVP